MGTETGAGANSSPVRPAERVERLREVSLFRELNPTELGDLALAATERLYPRDATLFEAGDPAEAVHVILTGAVKVFQRSADGREKTLAILGPGDCLGEVALLDGGDRSASAQTMAETRLLSLPRAAFLRALKRQPVMAEKLLALLAKRLRVANYQVEQLAFCDARERVAATLLALAEVHGTGPDGAKRIDLRLTHQELANLAGTTRETSSRILSELAGLGLIEVDHRHLVVRNPQGLRRLLP
ncbi:MAG: Crp/Fnr family transcriptional regulator [Bacillota bacterium]|nr:Crp/Fnr family transcriptional regulator [Bacillota bacterium]